MKLGHDSVLHPGFQGKETTTKKSKPGPKGDAESVRVYVTNKLNADHVNGRQGHAPHNQAAIVRNSLHIVQHADLSGARIVSVILREVCGSSEAHHLTQAGGDTERGHDRVYRFL